MAVMFSLAGGQGFEPQFLHPECNVLPLDDPPRIYQDYKTKLSKNLKTKEAKNERV